MLENCSAPSCGGVCFLVKLQAFGTLNRFHHLHVPNSDPNFFGQQLFTVIPYLKQLSERLWL